MHVTLLFYLSPAEFSDRTDPQRRAAFWAAFMPYAKALTAAGIVVGGAGLQPPAEAVSVRTQDGQRLVQDGPYAATKEQIGGFFIIDVPDIQTALEWADRYPAGSGGGVEVRPNLPAMT